MNRVCFDLYLASCCLSLTKLRLKGVFQDDIYFLDICSFHLIYISFPGISWHFLAMSCEGMCFMCFSLRVVPFHGPQWHRFALRIARP